VTFSYQVGSATLPASSKVTVTLPTGTASSTVVVAESSSPAWLVVTPASGYSPLALTLTANPTGLPPGNLSRFDCDLDRAGDHDPDHSGHLNGVQSPVLAGGDLPIRELHFSHFFEQRHAHIRVHHGGRVARFSRHGPNDFFRDRRGIERGDDTVHGYRRCRVRQRILHHAVWVRVGPLGSTPAGLTTSGVALSGSYVPVTVLLDETTVESLLPGSYNATITITPTTSGSAPFLISVNLVVSAGARADFHLSGGDCARPDGQIR
jgi:hypothetical protein